MTFIYLSSSWLAGIFSGSLVGFPRLAVLFAAVLILAALWHWRKCSLLTVLLCFMLFLFAISRYDTVAGATRDKGALEQLHLKGNVILRGVVVAEPDVRERHTSLVLAVREAYIGEDWTELPGKVLVQVPRSSERAYGEHLELRGKLEEPRSAGNFDYKSYLARDGIHYQMRYPRVKTLGPSVEWDVLAGVYSFKRELARKLDLALPEPQASLAKGILLGIRSSLPDELRSAFSRTNTSHILAISGWNITLVAGLLRVIGGRILGRAALVLLVIGGIGAYTILIGPQPSVVRAAIMGAILLVGEYFGRPSDIIVGLLFAAAGMTAFDPMNLWDVGFQLSFASTAGIALLVPHLQRALRFLPTWLSDSISVTLAAQLATLPIIAVVFGQFSTVTMLANTLVLPSLLPIMLTTATVAAFAFVWAPLAQAVGLIAWVFLTYMIRVVEQLASEPWAAFSMGQLAPLLALPYYGLLVALFTRKSATATTSRIGVLASLSLSTKLLLGVLCLGGVLAWSALLSVSDDRLHISFLDVGQGDATLIETPLGRRILVDGGPSPPKLLDALGRRMPFWSRSIDLVVLTHPNEDHLAGLIDVLERYDVKQVLEPRTTHGSVSYRRLQDVISSKHVGRIEAFAGQKIELEQGITINVLHPRDGDPTPKDPNASSIVLKLVAGSVSVLLTGDVDSDSQWAIVRSGVDLDSALLKVPHHGAKASLLPAFLENIKPAIAVISVGEANSFGHPAVETLEQLKDVQVLRTDLDGTIEVRIRDGTYEVSISP